MKKFEIQMKSTVWHYVFPADHLFARYILGYISSVNVQDHNCQNITEQEFKIKFLSMEFAIPF